MESSIYFAAYILLGAIAGLLSGLLGIGGGAIVVPGFIYLFNHQGIPSALIMHMAAATSLAAMITTTLSSVYGHYRKGFVLDKIFYWMVPGLLLGTIAGVFLGDYLHSQFLEKIFGILLLVESLKDFLTATKPIRESSSPLSFFAIFMGAATIGLLSGLLGVGGGVLMVPFLLFCGVKMSNSVAISAACGFLVAVIGSITFIVTGFSEPLLPPQSLGYIYWPAWLGVALASPLFAIWGATLHYYLPISALKRIFAVVLMVVAIQLLI